MDHILRYTLCDRERQRQLSAILTSRRSYPARRSHSMISRRVSSRGSLRGCLGACRLRATRRGCCRRAGCARATGSACGRSAGSVRPGAPLPAGAGPPPGAASARVCGRRRVGPAPGVRRLRHAARRLTLAAPRPLPTLPPPTRLADLQISAGRMLGSLQTELVRKHDVVSTLEFANHCIEFAN